MRSRSGCFAASPNRQQRHQQLIEQYVFSRRASAPWFLLVLQAWNIS
ncbi:hypothetical protein AB0758_46580 [Tolypothrix bouteillei VB521301_2]